MPVPRALAVVLEQLRRQLAADVERRQPGPLGAGADHLRAADPCDGLLDADLAQGFDRNEGVLAAADRDEGVAAQAELLPLPFQHFSLPFKGVRMACLRGTAAQASRTPGALRRAGRAGVGLGFGRRSEEAHV